MSPQPTDLDEIAIFVESQPSNVTDDNDGNVDIDDDDIDDSTGTRLPKLWLGTQKCKNGCSDLSVARFVHNLLFRLIIMRWTFT